MTGRWSPTVSLVLLAFVAVGAITLMQDLDGVWILVVALPLLVYAVLRTIPAPRWIGAIALVWGLIVIPVYALLGVDWLWAHLTSWRPDPLGSLALGALLIGAAAWLYLRPWWVRRTPRRPLAWTLGTALILVLVPPFGFWFAGWVKGDERSLEQKASVVSRLDVIVLTDETERPAEPEPPFGWSISTWRGQVGEGDRIRWDAAGAPPLVPRDDVDRVLLLMVDGGPERLSRADALPAAPDTGGEIERWLGLADRVTSTFTPTFALLRTDDDTRLRSWNDALAGRRPGTRSGRALSLEGAAGSRTAADLALALAVRAPTGDQDLTLAARHRPALFFDGDEPYPSPLNVDRLLASGRMKLCEQGQAVGRICSAVHRSADLHNGASHLAFEPDELAEVRDQSTIYVNVTRSGNDRPNAIYLDYWWYFPHNPAGAAGGALCGAGFVIAGVTCFDHQSDWEGVTVVLDGDSPSGPPTAVSYAQHSGVTRYTWRALQRLWDRGDLKAFGRRIDTGLRPLVFIARGTHASYPTICRQDKCRVGDLPIKENRHDGGDPWPRDERADCPTVCLEALPARRGGAVPALWNAFDGGWGTTECVLEAICTSSNPPVSPAFQGRYRHPWCADDAIGFFDGRFTRAHPPCTSRRPSAREITGNERLLALGDSFSSGQGAGSYDPGTNGGGNTCFRSPRAWPQELATRLHLVALPSLACSGAVIHDVTTGQLGRISGDPGVVTISIGGNDVGFANVIKSCLLGDCVAKYHRPSGDRLEAEIADVAGRLPSFYRSIRDAAPRARVVVLGYPRLFPSREDWRSAGDCLMRRQISGDEVEYLNALTPALNAAIAGAAKDAGVDFVDATEAFNGRELLCSGETFRETYLRPLQDRLSLVPASFHPNAAGHARLADVAARHLSAP